QGWWAAGHCGVSAGRHCRAVGMGGMSLSTSYSTDVLVPTVDHEQVADNVPDDAQSLLAAWQFHVRSACADAGNDVIRFLECIDFNDVKPVGDVADHVLAVGARGQ